MTEYFMDADNGNDGSAGTAIGTAWKTFSKFTATAVSGDLGTIRGGMSATYQLASPADLQFTADGTLPVPIRMEYDYDNQFSDHVDLSATATVTPTVGSKVWPYTADVSGVVAVGDVLYISGDDPREFAYEVDTVSTVTVTMFLPYKGAQAGAGKTSFNMQSMPKWGTAAGDFQVNLDTDDYWIFQGIHFLGTDPNGNVEIDSATNHVFRDCVFEGNGSGDFGIKATDDGATVFVHKCRFFNHFSNIESNIGFGGYALFMTDSLLDGNSVSAGHGVNMNKFCHAVVSDTELKNHGDDDVRVSTVGLQDILLRNVILASATEVGGHDASLRTAHVLIEDHDGTLNDTRQYNRLSSAEDTPVIQSDTGTVRSGGNTFSIKVTPSTDIANVQGWGWSRQLLFEHAFYATTASKQYDIYFRPNVTGNWTADPVAGELWIEVEYWGHVSNNFRVIKKSTGVIDMNGSTAWQALSVTVAPAQAGVLYLRGWYSKTLESAKTNLFFVDPKPVVT